MGNNTLFSMHIRYVWTWRRASMGFWGIDVLILTQNGKPVAMLRSLDDDSHCRTRICQYEALNNGKSIKIAKQLVLSKIEGQNLVLRKYGLRQHDFMSAKMKIAEIDSTDLKVVRKRLLPIEGLSSERYFKQIFTLIPISHVSKKRKERLATKNKNYRMMQQCRLW